MDFERGGGKVEEMKKGRGKGEREGEGRKGGGRDGEREGEGRKGGGRKEKTDVEVKSTPFFIMGSWLRWKTGWRKRGRRTAREENEGGEKKSAEREERNGGEKGGGTREEKQKDKRNGHYLESSPIWQRTMVAECSIHLRHSTPPSPPL